MTLTNRLAFYASRNEHERGAEGDRKSGCNETGLEKERKTVSLSRNVTTKENRHSVYNGSDILFQNHSVVKLFQDFCEKSDVKKKFFI